MPSKPIALLLVATPLTVLLALVHQVASQEKAPPREAPAAAPAGRGGGGRVAPPEQLEMLRQQMQGQQVEMLRQGLLQQGADTAALEDQQFEFQILQFFQQYDIQGAAATDRDRIRAEARKTVAELLEKQFALRQQSRLREIAAIDSQARRLRETLEKRAASRAQIVGLRLEELVNGAEGLGWNEGGTAASNQFSAYAKMMASMMMNQGAGDAMRRGAPAAATRRPATSDLLAKDQELEAQIRRTLDAVGDSPRAADLPPSRITPQVRKTVADLLDQQFTLRQQSRETEIAEVERRLAGLREALGRRVAAKGALIERRLDELFNEAEGLGWDEFDHPAAGGARRPTTARGFGADEGGAAPAPRGGVRRGGARGE